jgi:hypothetical protein
MESKIVQQILEKALRIELQENLSRVKASDFRSQMDRRDLHKGRSSL